ncbi:MAG: hypothetical protein JO016_14820 [Actinobacteria bacterium]|nr:hypothetical protein [Actinomycetota bacterium]
MSTTAKAGSPLTCFGFDQELTRLYFAGPDSGLKGLSMSADGWHPEVFSTEPPGRQLTCYGFNGTDPRVFYVGLDAKIYLVHLGDAQPGVKKPPGQPAPGSPVTCLGVGGQGARCYYVGTDHLVHELAQNRSGDFSFRNRVVSADVVATGSGLTCEQDLQQLVRVFYVSGADQLLHVAADDNVDDPDGMSDDPIEKTDPAPGSALTCFGLSNGDTRVYYLDREHRINEVSWTDDDLTNERLDVTAMPGSPLTCFGVEGQLARVYYLDDQAQVNELARVHGQHGQPDHWVNHPLHYTAAGDSALTCFGFQGKWTRLYYLDPGYQVNELAWDPTDKVFINTPL